MPPKRKAPASAIAEAPPKRSARAKTAPVRFGGQPVVDNSPRVSPAPCETNPMDVREFQQGAAVQLADSNEVWQDLIRQQVAVREGIDGANERLDTLSANVKALGLRLTGTASVTPMPQPPAPMPGTDLIRPQVQHHIPPRWPWVNNSTIESIANGKFNIYDLPKLHRLESARNGYTSLVVEGVTFSASSAYPQFRLAGTNFHSYFKTYESWSTAWNVYVAIRLSYAPEPGPGFAMFNECLAKFCQLGYEFSTVLDYAVAFFRKHQNSPSEIWFNLDIQLYSEHFVNAVALKSTEACAGRSTEAASTDISDQICNNWNRRKGCTFLNCLRRHVCRRCESADHIQLVCDQATTI
jgi:hypothetical protein